MKFIFDNYKYEKGVDPGAILKFGSKMSEVFKPFTWKSVVIRDGDYSYPIYEGDTNEEIVDVFEREFIKHYDKFGMKGINSDQALNMLKMGFTPELGEILLKDGNRGDETRLKITSGINLIIGASNRGKSTLTRSVARQLQVGVVNYSECTIPAVPDRKTLAEVIRDFISSDRSMLIIDSMSEFVYARGREAATTGGTSTDFLSLLTTLSSHLIMMNKALIITINTYAISPEALFDSYLGRVPTMFYLTAIGQLIYSTRMNFASRKELEVAWADLDLHTEMKEFAQAHKKAGSKEINSKDEYTFGSTSPVNEAIKFNLKRK